MADKLVIVESPAKAKTIAKFLGRGYKVEASSGHVRDLPKSTLGVDVDNNFEPKYITIRGRGDTLERIRKEAKGVQRVFLATDPDREGEAISWHLAHILGLAPDALNRVEFHEITQSAIRAAMKTPRAIDRDLVDAQQARRVLDRLVGYSISPLLWAKVRKGLSAGRVQSVATRIICDREDEIRDFNSEEYWTVTAEVLAEDEAGRKHTFEAKLAALDGKKADTLPNEQAANDAVARMKAGKFTVGKVVHGERSRHPAPPFTTSNLQQEAARKLGFATRKTMQIAQQLYEGVDLPGEGTVGLVSYIRTDSTRLSQEALDAAREYITGRYAAEYLPETPNIYKGRKNAQDAHEAIRPTVTQRTPESIKDVVPRDVYRLYKLIWDRFIASQMTSAVYATLTASLHSDNGVDMRFSGMQMRFKGFTALYTEGSDTPEEQEVSLPDLKENSPAAIGKTAADQHFTQPPQRYTEASLVRTLEEKGIGRPSTYAPTISTILSRGYIERESKSLKPTELGELVNAMMTEHFPGVIDIAFTAQLEEQLDAVEDGFEGWRQVISDFYGPFSQALKTAEATIEKVVVADEETDTPCEKCGAMMVIKQGRYGRFMACPRFPECRSTKPIYVTIEAPCPKCGAQVQERNTKKGRKFFGCMRYPDCEYVSWDKPVVQKCPQCQGNMVEKNDKRAGTLHVCTVCGHKEQTAED